MQFGFLSGPVLPFFPSLTLISYVFSKKFFWKVWLAPKEFIFQLGDFILNNLDKRGLLYEGGIVEWTGYLPATNMICAAGLLKVAKICDLLGDKDRKNRYLAAYDKIKNSLPLMFDNKRHTYVDIRYYLSKEKNKSSMKGTGIDTLFLWDTSVNFGFVWGYPDHKEAKLTNKFFNDKTTVLKGGLQYFEAPDPGLAAYGNDAFFFTTAGGAQYEAKYGSKEKAKEYIDWMILNSNTYGLMPERIYLNESDCSPASPLSWCCGELAASILSVW